MLRSSPTLHRDVLGWFAEHGRDFAWRRTRSGYKTLVAEIMLQQTQTSRVEPAYRRFLARFPTLQSLARASRADVIAAWSGLGYNRRAVSLHRAAQSIVGEHGGRVPRDPAVLRTLPGVGEYTASAVACFAYDADVAVVDTNIARVIARSRLGCDPRDASPAAIRAEASSLVPRGDGYRWNLALMDVGATLCRAASVACGDCPLRRSCAWRRNPSPRTPAQRSKAPPFEGSTRQARGAIVADLRANAERRVGELFAVVQESMRPRVGELVAALVADGLVELDGDRVRLVR